MLRIRAELLEAFEIDALGEVRARLSQRLREALPDQAEPLSPRDLDGLCRRAIRRARRLGLETEPEIGLFAAALLVYGDTFETDPAHPWARAILHDDTIDAEWKARVIRLHLLMDTGREV
jgi:hypothetical protein